jgi:nickel-dependent lactate racemase
MAIVSCGGYPRDINMIQAHKALEFAQHAVVEGGTIVLLAECREGLGHASFFPWFDHDDLEDFGRALGRRYEVYGQTAYSLRSKAARFRIVAVTALDSADVRKMGMEPAATLEDALAMIDPRLRTEPGYILPDGAEVLPRIG